MSNRTHIPVSQQNVSLTAWGLMALLALIWGGSFAANRLALSEVGVLTTVAIRVTGGAALLWGWIFWRRIPLPSLARAPALVGMGLLNNVIPFTLIVWGQSHIPSGLASILNGATAIFTVLLAGLFLADERLTPEKAVGVVLGFAGVVLVIGTRAFSALDLTSLGQLAVLGATFSYALAGLFARRWLQGIRPEASAAGMLTGAALLIVPAALLREGPPSLAYSASVWAGLAYLAFVASAWAYFLYYAVLRLAGAGNLSLVTLMIPPVSVVLGYLMFGERLQGNVYAGFAALALGLLIIDGRLGRAWARKSA